MGNHMVMSRNTKRAWDKFYQEWQTKKKDLEQRGYRIGNWADGTFALRVSCPDGRELRITVDEAMLL